MRLPIETKPAVWGFTAGAVALAIVGFTWGGWVTGSKSEANAAQRADVAVVKALAPICAEKFQKTAGASATLVELKKLDSWAQGEFVEKGGWAMTPGSSASQTSEVARACAALVSAG